MIQYVFFVIIFKKQHRKCAMLFQRNRRLTDYTVGFLACNRKKWYAIGKKRSDHHDLGRQNYIAS